MRIGIKLGIKKKLLCILFSNLKYSTDEVFLSIDANFYDYCPNFLIMIPQIWKNEYMSIFKMKFEQKYSFLKIGCVNFLNFQICCACSPSWYYLQFLGIVTVSYFFTHL